MFLSIVIPAYNAADYIETSLESIGKQSNKDFEIIVVDDGSSDQTSIVAEIVLKELGIHTYQIVQKKNGGVSSARNSGLKVSKGEYILFLDADDYIESNLVQNLYEAANTNHPQIVNWIFEEVNSNKDVTTNYYSRVKAIPGKISGTDILIECLFRTNLFLWTGSLMYNRDFLISNQIKYSEGCISGEDTEFILTSLSIAREVIFLKKTLSYYVKREGSITNSYNVRKFDAIKALQRTGEYLRNLNNPRQKDIVNYILDVLTIDSYITHYENCIKYLVDNDGYTLVKAINKLESDIELEYNNLSSDIKKLIRIRKERGIKSNVLTILFKASPKLYFKVKNTAKKLK